MKRKVYSTTKIVAWVLSGVLTAGTSLLAADGFSLLESQFLDPPDAFGVNCWWWWLNGNTDRDAIRSAQKSAFDHEICSGLNRAYFHTFTTSPASMGLPGQEYFAGTHVNPRVTWWGESAGFIDYMRRVQSVVQSGRLGN